MANLRLLGALHDRLTLAGRAIGAVALLMIMVSFCVEVFTRYFLQAPTSWAQEVVSYAFCISIFATMPYLTKTGMHVAVTFVIDPLAPRARFWAGKSIFLACFLICAGATWITGVECVRQFVEDVQVTAIHTIPQWWLSAFIVYGFGSSAIYYLRDLSATTLHISEPGAF